MLSAASVRETGENQTIKVLVVDDSIVFRRLLSRAVESIPGLELGGTASNGSIALKRLEQEPRELVLLDVEMPEMDGPTTLIELRRKFPELGVIMVSGVSREAADMTMRALEGGALGFVPKPRAPDPTTAMAELIGDLKPLVEALRIRLERKRRRLAPKPVVTPEPAVRSLHKAALGAPAPLGHLGRAPALTPPPTTPAPRAVSGLGRKKPARKFSVLAIGVSTGGPRALADFLPLLPKDFPIPIVLVQHMPPKFTASLASRLNEQCALTVSEAAEGDRLRPGHVLIAPGGYHMEIAQRSGQLQVHLTSAPPVKSCRPSVDVLFQSLSYLPIDPVLNVVLTGMGDDGTNGVAALDPKGSFNLVQDEASCVVYGMPRAVVRAGLADEQGDLPFLARRLVELTRGS